MINPKRGSCIVHFFAKQVLSCLYRLSDCQPYIRPAQPILPVTFFNYILKFTPF